MGESLYRGEVVLQEDLDGVEDGGLPVSHLSVMIEDMKDRV